MGQADYLEQTPGSGRQDIVAGLVARSRAAMAAFRNDDQAAVDDAVPDRARELAELAVADTGLGKVADKVTKNTRKTFGTLRDLLRAKTVGVIEDLPGRGLTKYAKPVGVVGAVVPSTNPSATPVNKAMMALKGGNAVIIAPAELARAGHPEDLVQVLPAPVSKDLTQALMETVDLVVVTGSQNNVRRAYSSGTPAIGVGAGNVPVIVDASADLADAASKIRASKIFDNATSCSSENALIILDEVYDQAMAALEAVGGYRADAADKALIAGALWVDGKLNRKLIAKDAAVFAETVGLPAAAREADFFLVEEAEVGGPRSFADEKLSLVLTVYRAADFEESVEKVRRLLSVQGLGHSCGIHTTDGGHARALAERIDVARVLVNQAHTFGNGGAFDNGLNFTLSMGCGTWAGNSISENLNYRHFINVTHLVTVIPEDRPGEDALFGSYWAKHGR
jgi:sulfoacetaldehyde dehydrogenase